jgi:hypothetical protein
MTEREELTCPKTGEPIDRKWIGKWSDTLYLAFCDCGEVHELVRDNGEQTVMSSSTTREGK